MAQTDVKRYGLQGPYVLAFTDGGEPSSKLYAGNLKTDWIDSLGIHGWVGSSGRGRVAGVGIKNMKSDYEYVVGFQMTRLNIGQKHLIQTDTSPAQICCREHTQ